MPGLSSYVTMTVLISLGAFLLAKGEVKKILETALLLACTLAVVIFFGQMMQGDARPAKVQSQVSEERAESALRLMSTINIGVAKAYQNFGALSDEKGKSHRAIDVGNAGMSTYFKTAEASLKDASSRSPDNPAIKAKLAVLLAVSGKDRDLLKSNCNALKNSSVDAQKQLGAVLWDILVQHASNDADPVQRTNKLKIIETNIPRGWYQDNALLALYKTSQDSTDYNKFVAELETRYYNTFVMCIGGAIFATICGFIGLVTIVIQCGSLGRSDDSEAALLSDSEKIGLDVSYKTIYAVFVGWMTSQLVIGEGLKLLPKNMFSLGGNPVGISAFSLVSYLIAMIPALVLIYLLALKPKGLNPIAALHLQFRTRKRGPFRLLLAGILSWCAIIPMVLLGSIAAQALGSQGSDNPVLPQIAAIASSKNILAIFLLYLTVAFMAPLCEETIFRGFLYSSLRTRIGIFPAILVTSLVFAFIHFDKGGALMLCALGPVLAVAFERTRSLIPSMIAHGLWNGGAFAVTLGLYFS